MNNLFGIISAVIALSAFFLSIKAYNKAGEFARNANTIPVFINLMNEYREKIQPSAYHVFNHFSKDEKENLLGVPISDIPDVEKRNHARIVSNYFDNLGILVGSGLIWKDDLLNFLGGTSSKLWAILGSYIIAERLKRKDGNNENYYQLYFEYFVQSYLEGNYSKRNKNFHLEMLDRRKLLKDAML